MEFDKGIISYKGNTPLTYYPKERNYEMADSHQNAAVEILDKIERHLKNISISLRVMEERDENREYTDNKTRCRNLKELYDFGDVDLLSELFS